MSAEIVRRRLAYALVVCVYVFLISPLIVVSASSFDSDAYFAARFPPLSLGLKWYHEIPPKFWSALGVSLTAASISSLISGVLGVLAALGIVRGKLPGTELLRSFFRIPLQIPLVVTGVVFLQFYYGLQVLLGMTLAATLPGLIIAYVFVGMPYAIGTVGSMLERLNPRLDEAAAILGCSRWRTFWWVTFPIVRPSIIAGMLYAFIVAFGDVPLSIFLSSPSYTTLPVEIFNTLQFDFNPSVLAISTLIAAVSVLSLWLIQRLVGLDMIPR
jgi:putative spermidine/putrescine transport system permease protein